MKEKGLSQSEAEKELIGVTHAEIGAYLLGLWGFSHPIIEAIVYHHNPGASLSEKSDVLTAVHLANAFIDEEESPDSSYNRELDGDYLKHLNVESHLPEWRQIHEKSVMRRAHAH